jgi:tyrosine-protein phosphatase YwqE
VDVVNQLPFRGQGQTSAIKFSFCVDSIEFERAALVDFPLLVSATSLETFYRHISQSNYQPIINSLLRYKEVHKTDDWLYYQLVRKAAQQISPKTKTITGTHFINGSFWQNPGMMFY